MFPKKAAMDRKTFSDERKMSRPSEDFIYTPISIKAASVKNDALYPCYS